MDNLRLIIDELDLENALVVASKRNDLLPRRPDEGVGGEVGQRFLEGLRSRVTLATYRPDRAVLIAVPKPRYVTRPASLLTLSDRTLLQALVARLAPAIEEQLVSPETVFAHRATQPKGKWADFEARPLRENPAYVVRADVFGFYEYVPHDTLREALIDKTGDRVAAAAVHELLTAFSGPPRGLPQGNRASDVLATLFLDAVDRSMLRAGLDYCRYGDDVRIAVDSFDSGRGAVSRLENALRQCGLALNGAKTSVLRRETYERQVRDADEARQELRNRLITARTAALRDRAEAAETLEELEGIFPEELLWDLYADRATVEDAIAAMEPLLEPDVTEIVERLYAETMEHAPWKKSGGMRKAAFHGRLVSSLRLMANVGSTIAVHDLRQLLYWAPDETDEIARYLRLAVDYAADDIKAEVEGFLRQDRFRHEWQEAWLLEVLARCLPLSDEMNGWLQGRAAVEDGHWLGRTHAMLVLAIQGLADRRLLERAWELAPAVFRAELIATGRWLQGQQAWAPQFLEGCRGDPVLEVVITHVTQQLESL